MITRLTDIVYGYIDKFGLSRFLVYTTAVVALSLGIVGGCTALYRGIRGLCRRRGDRAVTALCVMQTLGSLALLLGIIVSGQRLCGFPVPLRDATEGETSVDREALVQLRAANWAELDKEERLAALQVLVDVERENLGIAQGVLIQEDELPATENGCYNDITGRITINRKCLEEAPVWKVIEVVCHEMYHCYQHRLVEVYEQAAPKDRGLSVFEGAKCYREEFAHYIDYDGKENYEAYYTQRCESDARSYATTSSQAYYTWLEGEPAGVS